MTAPVDSGAARVLLTSDDGAEHDVTKPAMRYVPLRLKAAQSNRDWLDSGDDAHRRKRDDYLFRAVEIATTIRDLLGHDASKRFAREAERLFGPVRFWPE